MTTLVCHDIVFYTELDESAFFHTLEQIPAIKKISGYQRDLFIEVPSQLSQKTLREIIGIFYRYKIDMRQLAQFSTPRNHSWFHSPKAYWYRRVFGAQ